MATFERKASDIFHHETKLKRHLKVLIPKLFGETEQEFSARLFRLSKEEQNTNLMHLYDIAFMDFYYPEINDQFLHWLSVNHADRFTGAELEEIKAQAASFLDFYQVLEVIPGKGCRVQSIVRQDSFFLNDVSTSRVLDKWDLALFRCYPFRGKYLCTGSGKVFPPSDKDEIHAQVSVAFQKYGKSSGITDYARFAKDQWETMLAVSKNILEQHKNESIMTPYGPFEPLDVIFTTLNLKAAMNKMNDLDEFNFQQQVEKRDRKRKNANLIQYQFDWLSCGQDENLKNLEVKTFGGKIWQTHQLDEKGKLLGITVLGGLYVDKDLTRLIVHSRAIAEYGKERLLSLLGDCVKFKRIGKAQLKEDKSQVEEEEEIDEKTKRKIEQNFLNDYFDKLVDEPIEALDNLTLKQASRNPDLLPKLIEWFRDLENMQLKNIKRGSAYYDVGRLKKKLGIEF